MQIWIAKEKHLIYCITCPQFNENYICQTGIKLIKSVYVKIHLLGMFQVDICANGNFKMFPSLKIKKQNTQFTWQKNSSRFLYPKLNWKYWYQLLYIIIMLLYGGQHDKIYHLCVWKLKIVKKKFFHQVCVICFL